MLSREEGLEPEYGSYLIVVTRPWCAMVWLCFALLRFLTHTPVILDFVSEIGQMGITRVH